MEKIRLQKYLSQSGVASRRDAEVLIQKGLVKINGQKAKLGDKVDPSFDAITVRDRQIKTTAAEHKIYLILNKPAGYVCTRSDSHAEKTIYDLLPIQYKKTVWPVGRLDKDSCGLLILTNDGELTQKLTHPAFEHEKEYLVRINKPLDRRGSKKLASGLTVDGERFAPCRITAHHGSSCQFNIILHEGKKRQIRRMFQAVDRQVLFLERIREGNLTLANLPQGKYKVLKSLE